MNIFRNSSSGMGSGRIVILAIGLVFAAGIVMAGYAFFVEPNRLLVNDYQVRIPGSGEALNGLKVAVISDLHGGASFIDEEKLKHVADTVNSTNPDLVLILGDFVSQHATADEVTGGPLKMEVSTIAESIKGIQAKYGVFAVIGNHDDWYGRDKVRRALEKAGIRVLVDELAKIDINGSPLYLLGLRDFMSVGDTYLFREEARELVKDIDDGDLIILDHSPDVVPVFAGPGSISDRTRMFFAGHTHGGQVWFPIVGSMIVPSSYGQTFAAGNINYKGSRVFVTTGIGTSILPVRFLVPPEIAVVTINK
jgi:predicted MPP superfamily phosphohydrolase